MRYQLLIATPEYRGYGGGIMTFYRSLAQTAVSLGWPLHAVEGSAFDAARLETIDGVSVEGIESSRLEHWLTRFNHLAASPTVRRMLAAAWAAREQAPVHGPFDEVEAAEFGLLHVPYILEGAAPVVVQCHAGWSQTGLYEPTGGKEFDQALALAIETEGLRYAAARHSYANANASLLLDCPHSGFIVWRRKILAFSRKLKTWDSEPMAMAIASRKFMVRERHAAEIRQRVNRFFLQQSGAGYR